MVADLEFRIAGQCSDKRALVGTLFARSAYANGGFQNEKNVITTLFDPGNNFRNLVRVGQRLVDCFTQFFHQLLKLLVHEILPGPVSHV